MIFNLVSMTRLSSFFVLALLTSVFEARLDVFPGLMLVANIVTFVKDNKDLMATPAAVKRCKYVCNVCIERHIIMFENH